MFKYTVENLFNLERSLDLNIINNAIENKNCKPKSQTNTHEACLLQYYVKILETNVMFNKLISFLDRRHFFRSNLFYY